nr:uncharacterized protein CI109_000335 [Kwoniella shandongensis]KAA5531493.1 hypothetical protein CI109_000335 [Kwoniella shandongensis]
MSFAPHGWKAVLPLRYLGVDYETVYVTLSELREVLPRTFGLPQVTIPALRVVEIGGEERLILDSYNISQYSYACFPDEGPFADVASKSAFLAKCGQSKMDETIALNSEPEWTEKQYAAVRKELGTMEVLLRERRERGESGSFLGGDEPIHADFCVFA